MWDMLHVFVPSTYMAVFMAWRSSMLHLTRVSMVPAAAFLPCCCSAAAAYSASSRICERSYGARQGHHQTSRHVCSASVSSIWCAALQAAPLCQHASVHGQHVACAAALDNQGQQKDQHWQHAGGHKSSHCTIEDDLLSTASSSTVQLQWCTKLNPFQQQHLLHSLHCT
jgi:hypothetical protein